MNTPADKSDSTPAALEGRKHEWNITRILVGHDSNHGAIPEIGVLISSIERYNRDFHALLLEQNAEMREALEELSREEFRDDDDPILAKARAKARAALSRNGGKV